MTNTAPPPGSTTSDAVDAAVRSLLPGTDPAKGFVGEKTALPDPVAEPSQQDTRTDEELSNRDRDETADGHLDVRTRAWVSRTHGTGEPLWSRAWLRQAGIPEHVVRACPPAGELTPDQWREHLITAVGYLLDCSPVIPADTMRIDGSDGPGAAGLLRAAAAGLPVGTLTIDGESGEVSAVRVVAALEQMVPRLDVGDEDAELARRLAAALDIPGGES